MSRGCTAHHGLAGGVERAGVGVGHAAAGGGLCGCADFIDGGHGFDPDHIDAAGFQAFDLLNKGCNGFVIGEGAERHQKIACRANRARDDNLARRLVGDGAGDFASLLVELVDPVLRVVQLEPVAGAAEAVGQDDVGAGIDKILMQLGDLVLCAFHSTVPARRRIRAPWRTGWCRWRHRREGRLFLQAGRQVGWKRTWSSPVDW
jgi:hypothetical protein